MLKKERSKDKLISQKCMKKLLKQDLKKNPDIDLENSKLFPKYKNLLKRLDIYK